MRSGSTGRLRNAICTERISLSRSKGTRRLLRLMTVNSRSCTRSKVVKRKLQVRQTRRRRITAESSVGRESFTCVSRLPQLGQRMASPYPIPVIPGRHDRVKTATASLVLINRKSSNQCLYFVAHRAFDQGVFLDMLLREHIKNLDNHLADLAEFCDPETPGRTGRRAEPDAGRDRRLFRI